MPKTILVTGATDGIGLETVRMLAEQGHQLIVHGRSQDKIAAVENELKELTRVKTYKADLSNLQAVSTLIKDIKRDHDNLDVVINNAGVLKAPKTMTVDGLDIRFAVNTIAPYLMT